MIESHVRHVGLAVWPQRYDNSASPFWQPRAVVTIFSC